MPLHYLDYADASLIYIFAISFIHGFLYVLLLYYLYYAIDEPHISDDMMTYIFISHYAPLIFSHYFRHYDDICITLTAITLHDAHARQPVTLVVTTPLPLRYCRHYYAIEPHADIGYRYFSWYIIASRRCHADWLRMPTEYALVFAGGDTSSFLSFQYFLHVATASTDVTI